MSGSETYFNYWGKTGKDGTYHLLPYHCLDVAAVASAWWEQSPVIRRSFFKHARCDEKKTRAWLLFFISLHDYGKFDIRFQRKADDIRKKLYAVKVEEGLPNMAQARSHDHGSAGLYWIIRDLAERFQFQEPEITGGFDFFDDEYEPNEDWTIWGKWIRSVCGHHGYVRPASNPPDCHLPAFVSPLFGKADRQARIEWLKAAESLFLEPAGLTISDNPPQPSPLLAGFCSVADWLGSRCDAENFSFKENHSSFSEYLAERIKSDAKRVLKISGVIGTPIRYTGISLLLPENASPRSLQTLVDQLPIEDGLTIAEAPTGSGKTEMALAYAWRLIQAGRAESIIIAMPTQATANAMFDRLEALSTKIFHDHPNLILAHGNARFNDKFVELKRSHSGEYRENEGWAQCCQWLSESRKRVFLGQIGVCTVDQVLISVLPVRHRFIRGFGAGKSVLIVDEVHAYDAYMYGLLERVLAEQKAASGSAILLSATLPAHQRRQLINAWGKNMPESQDWQKYPLVSHVGSRSPTSHGLPASEKPIERHVRIEGIKLPDMMPDQIVLERVVAAADAGSRVAIICNLVDHAQQTYSALRNLTGLPVDLFHARYTFDDRQKIEERIVSEYGRGFSRNTGKILVATQVVEQSLDLDFDWMITQLCPIDLLFQRLGRLHRHDRPNRPAGFEKPSCTVLISESDFGLHGFIYRNTRVMWRTAEILENLTERSLHFPSAYRELIEKAYDESPWGNEPDWVEKGYEDYQTHLMVKRSNAQNMLNWADGFPLGDTDQNVVAVTRDDEMGIGIVPVLHENTDRFLMDGKKLSEIPPQQLAETLMRNTVNVPNSWRMFLEEVMEGEEKWLRMNIYNDNNYISEIGKLCLIYSKSMGMQKNGR